MIGVNGQYIFKFQVGDLIDFINEDNLIDFTLIEDAGGLLPTFELNFMINGDDNIKKFNEGNELKVSFGKDLDNLKDSSLFINSLETSPSGENKRAVSLKGLYNKIKYTTDNYISVSDSKSSFKRIEEIASKYFDVRTSGNSSESQKWIQYNITDKKHIVETYMHAVMPNGSFPIMGITMDGRFLLKDFKPEVESGYVWKFCSEIVNPEDIIYDGQYMIKDRSGFMNNQAGYGRKKLVYDMIAGNEVIESAKSSPILALSNKLNRSSEVDYRSSINEFKNENIHDNFWSAYLSNMSFLMTFSSISNILSFSNVYHPINILDIVYFKDFDTNQGRHMSTEFITGLYIVSKVSLNLTNRQLTTLVILNREAFNQIQGQIK